MSDTPRIATASFHPDTVAALLEEGKKLERELAAVTAERDEIKEQLEEWRFHGESWGTNPHEVRKHIKQLTAECDRTEASRAAEFEAHRMTKCELAALTAERDALKADKERLNKNL